MALVCKSCEQTIDGNAMLACGDYYHNDCFICSVCALPFPDGVFLQHEGLLFCENDYNNLVADKCGKCGEIIDGECINAIDQRWHKECFSCVNCRLRLAGVPFMRLNDKPYCKGCHDDAVKEEQVILQNLCLRCKKPIDGEVFFYKDGKYHAYHFNCTLCKKELKTDCKEHEGKLYCPEDYKKVTAPSCYACKKLIMGTSITALGKAFHPEHFVCFKCERPFENSVFYEHQGKAYCSLHYHEVTGVKCNRCLQVITGDVLEASGRKYCSNHFVCHGCDVTMVGKAYTEWDLKPFCEKCYMKIPLKVRKRLVEYRMLEKKIDKRGKKSISEAK
ncbi:hypothetical protein BKA69DRAFT_1156944 [Paraphysoderma sedebokerense]|nr:hypothetical protein BKA69DRAFT_1156944 [Paraphysoderma sedebokerense]